MITIRKACLDDAARIVQLRSLIWQETYQGIYPDEMLYGADLKADEKKFAARIADPAHQLYLYCDGEECIGYFAIGPSNYGPYKDFDLCLNNLYIRKEYKGCGLGRRAFEVICDYCRANGISKFFCGCNFHNRNAVEFYRHMGGIQGDIPVFHENKYDDILHFEFTTGVEI